MNVSVVHVRNLAEALRVLAGAEGVGGEVFFVSDGAPVDFRTFMTQYCLVSAHGCEKRWGGVFLVVSGTISTKQKEGWRFCGG